MASVQNCAHISNIGLKRNKVDMEEHVASRSSTYILVSCILHVDLRCGPASCIMQPGGGVGGGRRSRRRRTRTLHICKTEGTWKWMQMTGTAAARDCLDVDVGGRNFCFLVSWPQDGRQAGEDARGEERRGRKHICGVRPSSVACEHASMHAPRSL